MPSGPSRRPSPSGAMAAKRGPGNGAAKASVEATSSRSSRTKVAPPQMRPVPPPRKRHAEVGATTRPASKKHKSTVPDDEGDGAADDSDSGRDQAAQELDADEVAAARRIVCNVDVQPRLVYTRAEGSGYTFPGTGSSSWNGQDLFVSRKAARAELAAKEAAAKKAAPKKAAQKKAAVKKAPAKKAAGALSAASKAAASGPRCTGKCRLAWPCPTDSNKSGRGACGNAGCTNHGAVYGCRPCGIRLCSFECINAHMFEGRAIKPGLRPVEFHDWYHGE